MSRQSASVPDVQRDRLIAVADGERGLLERRLGHHRADAVGQRIALDRQAEKVRVQMVVAVFVGLYATPSKFLNGNQSDAIRKVRASTTPITVAFDNLPPGDGTRAKSGELR